MARVKQAARKAVGPKPAKASKLPVKKTVEKQVADLEAAAAERKQLESEWLSKADKDVLDPSTVAGMYKKLWGDADPTRTEDDVKPGKSGPATVDLEAPPPIYGGVLSALGTKPRESASTLTAFMADSQMRDRVLAQRKTISGQVSGPDVEAEKVDLDKAKRILKIFEANGGKLPATFKMSDVEGDASDEEGSEASGTKMAASVQAALAGVFAFLRKAARESPQLCVEPLDIMNTLVNSLDPQAMLSEQVDTLRSMHGFFSSLCTEELAAIAALGADVPETKLVPASLSGATGLAIVRGTMQSLLTAVELLLTHVGKLPDNGTLKFPLPQPLLKLSKVARGPAAAGVATVPTDNTPVGASFDLQLPDVCEGLVGSAVAVAAAGPYLYAVISRLDVVVKVGTGLGTTERGRVYASAAGVLGRLLSEGGAACRTLEDSLLWAGVVHTGSNKPLLLLREQSMRAGLLVAYDGNDLMSIGVYRQSGVSSSRVGTEIEETKGVSDEADAKLAASVSSSAGGLTTLGFNANTLAIFDESGFLSLEVDSVPTPFYPEDLPAVKEGDAATKWPAPLSATVALRTFAVSSDPRDTTFKEVSVKRGAWGPSSTDCRRVVSGKPGWIEDAEELAALPSVLYAPPLQYANKPRRPVYMASTKTGSFWLTDDGRTYFEGIGGDLGIPNAPAATLFEGVGDRIKAVAAASHAAHVLFLTDSGTVVALGEGENGQLGDGKSKKSDRVVPTDFTGKSKKKDKKKKGKKGKKEEEEDEEGEVVVIAVAVTARSSAAVSADGKLYGWGSSAHPEADASDVPKPLNVKSEGKVTGVAAGTSHFVVLTDASEIITFGKNNTNGVLGRTGEDYTPNKLKLPTTAAPVKVVCGDNHTVVLTSAGEVLTFGNNEGGQCGGDAPAVDSPHIVALPGKAIAVAAGEEHSVVLLEDGRVFGWGKSKDGQLGHTRGVTDIFRAPVELVGLSHPTNARVFAGAKRTAVIRTPQYIGDLALRSAAVLPSHAANTLNVVVSSVVDKAPVVTPFVAPDAPIAGGAGGGDAAAPVVETCVDTFCRTFKLSSFRHVSDGPAAFPGLAGDACAHVVPVCAPDITTGVVWAAGAKKEDGGSNAGSFLMFTDSSTSDVLPEDASGSSWLSNPQFALSSAPGAEVTADVAAGTLMASLDALYARLDAGLPDVDSEPAAPVAAAAKPAKGKKRASREPEECMRYEPSSIVNGWGMGSTDSVIFKVDQDCMLLGLGVFGGNSKCKINAWICEGRTTTSGDRVADYTFEIEDTTNMVHPGMLDAPIRLSADTEYCFADKSVGDYTTGWYANSAKDPSGKVEMECGITVTFSQTGDPSNNGTSPTRGRCAALYLLPMSAFKSALEDDEEDAAVVAEKLPVVKAAQAASGLDSDGLSSLLRIADWCVGRLTGEKGTLAASSQAVVRSILAFTLRQLTAHLKKANVAPKPKPATSEEDGEEGQDGSASKEAGPAPWVSSDAEVYATTLWDIDVVLRRILNATGGVTNSLRSAAQNTLIGLFDTLYPTRRLKQTALNQLLNSTGSEGSNRLLAAVMDALSTRDDVALFLDGDGNVPTDDVLGGAEESKSGEESKSSVADGAFDGIPISAPTPVSRKPKAAPEVLTSFLRETERVLLGLHQLNRSDSEVRGLEGGASLMLSLISAGVNAGVSSFVKLGGAIDTDSKEWSDFRVPEYVSSSVRLLTAMHREAVIGLTKGGTAPVVAESTGKKSRLGPVEQCKKYNSVSSGWGNGSQDAFCFTVDTPVYISGIGMYGYSNGTRGSQTCKFSLHEGDGTSTLAEATEEFDTEGTQDPGEMLFESPVLIDADTQYSIRATITTGGSTYYGNGADSYEGDDGIKWKFAYSSQSNNGTGATSGQIPLILYQLPKKGGASSDDGPVAVAAADSGAGEAALIEQSQLLLGKADELLNNVVVANIGVSGDSNQDAVVLHPFLARVLSRDPFFTELLPLVMVDLVRVCATNSTISKALLPQLAGLVRVLDRLNIQSTLEALQGAPVIVEEEAAVAGGAGGDGAPGVVVNGIKQPHNYRHYVLETEHPYQPAQKSKWEISFPSDVNWLVVEFDPKCTTGQLEDKVSLYADSALRHKLGSDYSGGNEGDDVTWPKGPVVVPGNHLSVVFQSATDYGNVSEEVRWGIRATVTGHTSVVPSISPLLRLEVELSYLLGVCLAHSLAPLSLATKAAVKTDEEDADAKAKDGKKGKKGKKPRTGASSAKWVSLPDGCFDSEWANGVTITDDNMHLASSGNGHALLNYGISRGKMAMEVKIDKETDSQCTCLGVAVKEGLAGAVGTSYNHGSFYMYRFFNGALYKRGPEIATGKKRVFQGDTVRVELDMDEGTVTYIINDDDQGVMFDGLQDLDEVFLAVNFYSASRELTLERVEVAGAAVGDCGLKIPGQAAAEAVVAVAAPSATVVPPSVFTAIGGGLFEGGLASDNASSDSHIVDKQKFLDDFIRGDAGTQGGRLGAWLCSVADHERSVALACRRAVVAEWRASLPAEAAEELETLARSASKLDAVFAAGAKVEVAVEPVAPPPVKPMSLIRSDSSFGDDPGVMRGLFGDEDDEWQDGPVARPPPVEDLPAAAAAPAELKAATPEDVVAELAGDGGWEWSIGNSELSDTQALSGDRSSALRAAFAALLWHHGLLADAMMAASYLRFHASVGLGPIPNAAALVDSVKAVLQAVPAGAEGAEEKKEGDAPAVPTPQLPKPSDAALKAYAEACTNTEENVPSSLRCLLLTFRAVLGNVLGTLISEQANEAAAAAAAAAAKSDADTATTTPGDAPSSTDASVVTAPSTEEPSVVVLSDDDDFDDDHRLAKYSAPSVLCPKCSMYGPSMQTGNEECVDCRLCEKCCEKEENESCAKANKDNRGRGATLAEDGFGGFPVSGGVAGGEKKKKKKKGKKGEEEDGDDVPIRVRNYVKHLVKARTGLKLRLEKNERMGGEYGGDRGFKIAASGGFVGTLEDDVTEKKPGFLAGPAFEAEDGSVRYFEVEVTALSGEDPLLSVGWLPGTKLQTAKHLGETSYSMGYNSGGEVVGSGFPSAPSFGVGDVIGVGWVFIEREKFENINYVFFTKNGEEITAKYWAIRNSSSTASAPKLAPCVTGHGRGAVSVNFGQKPFKFAEMESARAAAFARGEFVAGAAAEDLPVVQAVSTSEPLSVGILKRSKLLLRLEALGSSADDITAVAAELANSSTPKVKAADPFRPGLRGLGLDAGSSPKAAALLDLPTKPPALMRGATTMGLGRPVAAPTPLLRRAASVRDATEEETAHGHEHDTLVAKPSSSLSKASIVAKKVLKGSVKGVSASGGFLKGLEGVIAFALSGLSADVFEAALRQREEAARARLQAIAYVRSLVESVRVPQALQQILWFLGTALSRSPVPAGAPADAAVNLDENVVLSDLRGCGLGLFSTVRDEFHRLLDALSMQVVAPCKGAQGKDARGYLSSYDPYSAGSDVPEYVDLSGLSDEHRMVQMLALRAWRAKLGSEDQVFLQSCTLFSNLKAVMGAVDAARPDVIQPRLTVNRLRDVTAQFVPSVSSNKDRLYCVTDSSTDTFWEPAGNKPSDKNFVQFEFGKAADGTLAKEIVPAAAKGSEIVEIAVHIDTGRDKANAPSSLKLFSGNSPDFLNATADDSVVVPAKFAGWLLLRPLSPVNAKCLQVVVTGKSGSKCRLRGVRLYANDFAKDCDVPADRLDVKAEALHVFRDVAEAIFAGLTKDAVAPAAGGEGDAKPEGLPPVGPALLRRQSSDLRERVAGMLFSDSSKEGPLKSLQQHLFQMIATELVRETGRRVSSRSWAKKSGDGAEESKGEAAESDTKLPEGEGAINGDDSYCYELVCMLSSLSDTDSGRLSVAQPTMVGVLLALLPVGSPRVQRQILVILRRVLLLVDPIKLDDKVMVPHGLLQASLDAKLVAESRGDVATEEDDAAAQLQDKKRVSGRGAAVAWLLMCYAKSVDLQVRGRADGRPVLVNATLPDDIIQGSISSALAVSIKGLIEGLFVGGGVLNAGNYAEKWKADVFAVVRGLLLTLPTQLSKTIYAPARSTHMPHLWAALSVMASVGQRLAAVGDKNEEASNEIAAPAGGVSTEADLLKPVAREVDESALVLKRKRVCENHDDGVTEACWACMSCVDKRDPGVVAPVTPEGKELTADEIAGLCGFALCDTCDGALHLPRTARGHKRVPIKIQTDEALKVEYVGGCSRVKLGWLLVSMFDDKGKAMVEFKRESKRGASGSPQCRFCESDITAENRQPGTPVSPALEFVCNSADCLEKCAQSCTKTLDCGHLCGGVRGEEKCLPCYQGCNGAALEKDAYCTICYTEPLGQAPAIRLNCGHGYHYGCVKSLLESRWNGPRINFGFMNCPLCKSVIDHPSLKAVIEPLVELRKAVRAKALMRLKYENKDKSPEITTPGSEWYNDPEGFAEQKFAYYLCFKCGKPYYGGEVACAAAGASFDPSEFICGGCAPWSGELDCPKHGKDFIEFKCRYCCSVAVWFCFGTTHFCEPCHSRHSSPGPGPCPWVAGKKYDGDKCPLGLVHPPTGEEFPLGCGVCRNAQTF